MPTIWHAVFRYKQKYILINTQTPRLQIASRSRSEFPKLFLGDGLMGYVPVLAESEPRDPAQERLLPAIADQTSSLPVVG